jgi:hypothetical protein
VQIIGPGATQRSPVSMTWIAPTYPIGIGLGFEVPLVGIA